MVLKCAPICRPPVVIPIAAALSDCGNQRVINEFAAGVKQASAAPTAILADTAYRKLSRAIIGSTAFATAHNTKLPPTIHLPLTRSAHRPVTTINNDPAFCAAKTIPSCYKLA